MRYAIALVVALSLNAAANLMIKFGMRGLDAELGGAGLLDGGLLELLRLVLRHWVLLAGLVCFGLNVVFYAYALQKLPISVAYPIMVASTSAIILGVAAVLLHERLTLWQWIGVAAILAGVFLVAKDAGHQVGDRTPASPAARGVG